MNILEDVLVSIVDAAHEASRRESFKREVSTVATNLKTLLLKGVQEGIVTEDEAKEFVAKLFVGEVSPKATTLASKLDGIKFRYPSDAERTLKNLGFTSTDSLSTEAVWVNGNDMVKVKRLSASGGYMITVL